MITAKFSNGHTDTYKGQRDVKAAWMIVRKSDGEVMNSGHSLDRARAEKTAEGNCRYTGEVPAGFEGGTFHLPRSVREFHGIENKRWMIRRCRQFGLLDDTPMGVLTNHQLLTRAFDRARDWNARYYAAQRDLFTIEIVDL